MEPVGITLIIIYIIAIVLAIWLLGKVLKVILVVSLLTVLLLGGIAFFVYKDVVDIKANAKEGLMVVLADDGNILSGFAIEDEPIFFTNEQLTALSSQYQKKEYKQMLGDRFKLFIVDAKMVEELGDAPINSLGDSQEEETASIPASVALAALRSENPALVLTPYTGAQGIDGGDPSQIKGMLLGAIFTRHIIQSPANAAEQLKKDNLNVYPETAVFKILHYVPTGLIKNLAGKAAEKGSDAKDAVMEKI
ncbi:MAG TPA: hypothetical protein VJB12_01175 [Candidatus Nanoarchaeia archaeon]|nr:hypothetical protein [Candidatus Nanoarchaeia archaeon]